MRSIGWHHNTMPAKRPLDDKNQTPRRASPYRPSPSPTTNISPHVVRKSHRLNSRGQRVKKLSEVLTHDLGGIVETTVLYFKKNILPKVKDIDLFRQSQLLAETLKRKGVFIVGGWWLGFQVDPSQHKEHEDKVFAKLKDIWDAVIEESKELPALKPLSSDILVKLTAKPRNHGKGVWSNRAQPDLLFELHKSHVVPSAAASLDSRRYLFSNIVAFVEAKKHITRVTRYQVRIMDI